MRYTGPVMNAIATENIVIGVLAGIGVVVLAVMLVYLVKRIMREE
jgi:ABC-type proline/glycine betaine transport system permease subunit